MEINSALEGTVVCDKLRLELAILKYNPDLKKMLKNIEQMVTEISKLEVVSRQHRSRLILDERLIVVNAAINHFEKLILIAKLMD